MSVSKQKVLWPQYNLPWKQIAQPELRAQSAVATHSQHIGPEWG